MGRRKKCRLVAGLPETTYFKPQGVPLQELQGRILPVEGLEALRLVDGESQSQEQAAESMGVSRPTLCRILAEARRTVALALSRGEAIRIDGGDYTLESNDEGVQDGACPLHGPYCRGRGRGCRRRETGVPAPEDTTD